MLRNRIIFIILLITSSVLAYYIPNILTSIFFHAVIFLMLLSFIHLIYSYIMIKASQSVEPNIVEHGHTTSYFCDIYNEGLLASSVITARFTFNENMFENQLEPKTFTLQGEGESHFEYRLSCRYRGVYALGIESIDMIDVLNIFRLRVNNIEQKKITILPKVTLLHDMSFAQTIESNLSSAYAAQAKDATSLVDVRKFQQGDALKLIHWKLSARHNELLIRNLESSVLNSTLVFLDTYKGDYAFADKIVLEDKLMEALVSIVNQRLSKNHRVEINYYEYDDKNTTYSRAEDFRSFYMTIAEVLFCHKKRINTMIDDYFTGRYNLHNLMGKDIFIFTCNPEMLDAQMIMQKLLGINSTLHIVSCINEVNEAGAFRTVENIHYYNLAPSSALQDIFTGSV